MASQPLVKPPNRKKHKRGLEYWSGRVLKEYTHAEKHLDPDVVHDFRVALRRCRSIAKGMEQLDPHPAWHKFDRFSKKLFKSLGELRDSHVLTDWVKKLGSEDDPVRLRMLEVLHQREKDARDEAQKALEKFGARTWRRRSSQLAERAQLVPSGGLAFQHLALEQWERAYALHRRALRTRSGIAYHRCRIGLKHFRYTIENFLPRRSAAWRRDLKMLQDALGDVHDLDELRGALRAARPAFEPALLEPWINRIGQFRSERLREYHSKTTGRNSLWPAWRRHLPSGQRLESVAMAKLETWAAFLDPDFRHSRHVSELAVQLFDSLRSAGFDGVFTDWNNRKLLRAAALLHDVGKSEGPKNHHKSSYRMICGLRPPLGWSRDNISRVALVARYHRGVEPQAAHEGYGALSAVEQQKISWLAGVLRLADSLDSDRSGKITRLNVSNLREALVINVEGCSEEILTTPVMEKKHLLEMCAARPVIIRPVSPNPAVAA